MDTLTDTGIRALHEALDNEFHAWTTSSAGLPALCARRRGADAMYNRLRYRQHRRAGEGRQLRSPLTTWSPS